MRPPLQHPEWFLPECHTNPTCIIGGKDKNKGELWIAAGREIDETDLISAKIDLYVPLSGAAFEAAEHWFDGVVWGMPMQDYHVWPLPVLRTRALAIIKQLSLGKKIMICCSGGHGRTGTLTAAILYLGCEIADPVAWLRKRYCEEAVETKGQLRMLADLCRNPAIMEHDIWPEMFEVENKKEEGQ